MGNSKKVILISIIVVVALLVITGGVFAYTYFFTDAFKTEQQLFYKYIAKNSEIIEFLEDKKINEYNEKLKISPYNNNGEASIAISGNNDESAKAQTEELKKYKLTYDGGVNKNNQYSHENLKLLYNENELLGGTLIHKNDYYGINVSVAPQKYIVLENNNLKQFAKNMGMSEEQVAVIPDKINFEDIKNQFFTKEELKEILNRYLKVIADNLNADLFSKNKTDDGYVYTLTIDERTYKTVVNALIDTLKNDDQLLNKIKEIYVSQGNTSEEETQQLINMLKENLEDSKSDVSNIEEYI